MTNTQFSRGLMLVTEATESARPQIEAALCAGAIASVCFVPVAGDSYNVQTLRPLISLVQKTGAAALLADDAGLARTLKADGVHLSAGKPGSSYADARDILGRGCIVGADAGRSRDTAMHLGEDGADYIGFGIPDFVADRAAAWERRLDLIQWWAEIFEVPCVAFDVDSPGDAQVLAEAGADFVALRLDTSLACAETSSSVAAMLAAIAPRES